MFPFNQSLTTDIPICKIIVLHTIPEFNRQEPQHKRVRTINNLRHIYAITAIFSFLFSTEIGPGFAVFLCYRRFLSNKANLQDVERLDLFKRQCTPSERGVSWLLTVLHVIFHHEAIINIILLLCFHIHFSVAHLKTRGMEGVICVSSHAPSSLTIVTLAWTARRSPVHTEEDTQREDPQRNHCTRG
ncbi:hypothetical protein EDD85DRAFT_369692 [Armillaria nabsnona]|nr:hypothetical protein EDD85DRAFT_369692 [Armillaria nabsnona]